MRILLIPLLAIFVSCPLCQNPKTNSIISTEKPEKELPAFVQKQLTTELAGWQLAPPDSWEDTTFQKYLSDTSQIHYLVADLNCDSKPDFTAILKDSTGNFAAFLIHSIGEYYTSSKLESYGSKGKLDIGLKFLDSKTLFEHYDGSVETFKCGAVERCHTQNKAKKIFYANEKGLFEISVGE